MKLRDTLAIIMISLSSCQNVTDESNNEIGWWIPAYSSKEGKTRQIAISKIRGKQVYVTAVLHADSCRITRGVWEENERGLSVSPDSIGVFSATSADKMYALMRMGVSGTLSLPMKSSLLSRFVSDSFSAKTYSFNFMTDSFQLGGSTYILGK